MAPSTVTAVVLAAGGARRFGGRKVLAQLEGQSLLAHVVSAAVAANVHDAVLVLPPRSTHGDIHHAAEALIALYGGTMHFTVAENAGAALGMSTSLRVGFQAAARLSDPQGRIAVVLLADQPTIEPDVVRAVVQVSVRTGCPARAVYRDGAGPPVAIPLRLVASLAKRLQGDRGLRDLLDGLQVIDFTVEGVMPRDVDRPRDLEALRER